MFPKFVCLFSGFTEKRLFAVVPKPESFHFLLPDALDIPSINKGTAVEEKAINPSRNQLQTVTLLEKLEEGDYDAAFGGGRRDEEKARAKQKPSQRL